MLTLRLTQVAEGPDQHRVELALEGDGPRQSATSRFKFAVSEQDREDVRWYLEDYLQYPLDPAPKIAARIEKRMAEIGTELFKGIFQSNDDARDLWAALRPKLSDTRVEIVTGAEEATTLPWERLHDPKTDVTLALRAQSFVRTHPGAAERPRLPQAGAAPIRILLVICRPRGGDDVPFRSVASRLLKGLSGAHQDALRLDVLRPPTFEQLSRVLREAKAQDEPYHVVHFDGHGTYGKAGPRAGAHGYLLFENPALEDNHELVDGPLLGSLLVETEVPVLVLNACRSAHADPAREPEVASGGAGDSHAKVRALGSLAHEIMDTGATAVVAMRYNVYVETAAQFMAVFYESLAQGFAIGEATSLGRKQLAAQPLRQIAFEPTPLQDWTVPVVFEASRVALFPRQTGVPTLRITLGNSPTAPERCQLDPNLPERPDAGFFGRDETLLALDRSFDTQSIVLLHAWAGSGKTTTAAEFARWYSLTGGVEGPVLFTSFEQCKPLPRVLDAFGSVFQKNLEDAGVHWGALDDPKKRRAVVLQVMAQVPVLWIWDNVEPVAGFPAGTSSKWSGEEQKELADFLHAARDTKAKFLLTSRRDERGWLGDLPARVQVPPMPFQERVQLASELVKKRGGRLTDVQDWRPLLEFTQGNPLTITVLVGQALRDGLRTKQQVAAFVDRLRKGEAAFKDEAAEGRTKSLAASLGYGFAKAFNEAERKHLALLHLFQGFVEADSLRCMGNPGNDYHLPEIRGVTFQQESALLSRAAEIGLLTARGGGNFSIHPALPWFFQDLYSEYYAGAGERPVLAFVETMGALGEYYVRQYSEGRAGMTAILRWEEANLLQALDLARVHGWWDPLVGTMQGLRSIYQEMGRTVEWAGLVEEILPAFVDPETNGPLAGQEEHWAVVNEYRIRLAEQTRQFERGVRLQRDHIDWIRQRASGALELPREQLTPQQRIDIHNLAIALHGLAEIERKLDRFQCIYSYVEAYDLGTKIGDPETTACAAYNLGTAYKNLKELRNLEEAEIWYRRSLELTAPSDDVNRAGCLMALGIVCYERFQQAQTARVPKQESLKHLHDAMDLHRQALDLFPRDAINDLATVHYQLGLANEAAGEVDRALKHYQESIGYDEASRNIYGAAQTRHKVARTLEGKGSFADAREYALAALRGFQSFGDRAKDEVMKALELIARIEQALKAAGK
jgi:tetratricopeptide (TPR) repeat protein